MTDERVELAALNQTERDILQLLAQGHTVKSIAASTDRSVGSINERLREARRKTGIGSSRELARILAQENRDEKTGVVQPWPDQADLSRTQATIRFLRSWKGAAIMLAMLISVAVAGAVLTDRNQAPSISKDPRSDPMVSQAYMPSMKDYYGYLRKERRDPAWAPRTEAILRDAYTRVLVRNGVEATPRVICAATVCEIAIKDMNGAKVDHSRLMSDLQGNRLYGITDKNGLTVGLSAFGNYDHICYWMKASAKADVLKAVMNE